MGVIVFRKGDKDYKFNRIGIKKDTTIKQILDIAESMGIDKVFFKWE